MDTSSPHDIEKLSDSISFSSRVSGSRSDPTLSTHDRLNESTKRKIVSSREDGDPSATAPTSPLGTLGRLPPELRIIIYKYVAEDCSILPNKQKKLSNMADRELFPHFLLTSKQLCREIIEFDEKFARPIIILVQSADGERLNWSLSDATDSTFASTWQKATELTIVAEYCPREGRWGDMLEHDHVFLALLYRNILVARDSRIRHDKVTHAHFIWYIDNWSKVQGSEKPRSTLHELVKNLIDDGIWDYLLGSKRFPNLTEVEIGIRSRSAATQLHYNYHFRMKDGKYIADTIFAAPSTQWSTLFVTCLTVVALYILK